MRSVNTAYLGKMGNSDWGLVFIFLLVMYLMIISLVKSEFQNNVMNNI